MLEPRKRTALDGKVWWCAYNVLLEKYSTDIRLGKYKTKKECQFAIDNLNHTINFLYHTNCDYCYYQKMSNGMCTKGIKNSPTLCKHFAFSCSE